MKKYKLAAMGGTFDRLHKGHKTLLTHASQVAEFTVVGITTDEMVKHKPYAYCIQTYEERKKNVQQLVETLSGSTFEIVKLRDIFGPTLTDHNIDCLVVSPLTEPGAKVINRVRQERQLPELPIEVCVLEKSSDGIHISSERIRRGLIDRKGFVYSTIFTHNIQVSDTQKKELKKPLGELISGSKLLELPQILKDKIKLVKTTKFGAKVLAVGDSTSYYCYQHKIAVDLCVFDNLIERKTIDKSIQSYLPSSNVMSCINPAGTISAKFGQLLLKSLSKHVNIKIIGEEDLTLLPCIMLLPLGSVLLYGQPGEGVVIVEVTEERKKWVRELLRA